MIFFFLERFSFVKREIFRTRITKNSSFLMTTSLDSKELGERSADIHCLQLKMFLSSNGQTTHVV